MRRYFTDAVGTSFPSDGFDDASEQRRESPATVRAEPDAIEAPLVTVFGDPALRFPHEEGDR